VRRIQLEGLSNCRCACSRWVGALVAIQVILGMWRTCAAQWTIEPVHTAPTAGWQLSLDLDPNGRPMASYYTIQPNGYEILAARTSAGWQETQVVEFGLGMALDHAGIQYVLNRPSPDFYPTLFAIGAPSPTAPIESLKISENAFVDFDSHNQPRVAYIDSTNQRLRTATWNAPGWQIQTVATGPGFGYGNSYAVATLDQTDHLQFAFPTGAGLFNTPIGYAHEVQGVWTTAPTGITGDPLDLKVDSAGQLNLLFDRGTSPGLFLATLINGSWSIQQLTSTALASNTHAKLAFDPAGVPHIFAHFGNGSETVAHIYKSNGIWQNETVASWVDSVDGPEQIAAMIDGNAMRVLFSTGNEQVFYASRAVPEPASGILVAVGMAGTCVLARRFARRL
jgi:hypothetical protein